MYRNIKSLDIGLFRICDWERGARGTEVCLVSLFVINDQLINENSRTRGGERGARKCVS
jgi:hypothetical protein